MTSVATIDPTAAAISAARDELLAELRQLLAGDVDQVDGLLDRISKALRSARGKVGRARKRAAATTVPAKTEPAPRAATKPAPATPSKPAPAAEPKRTPRVVPAKTPATPRSTTITIPRAKPAPTKPAGPPRPAPTKPAAPDQRRTPTRRTPRPTRSGAPVPNSASTLPAWCWPVLLLLAVLAVLVAPAWTGWAVTAVASAAAWLTRSRWAPLIPTRRIGDPR